MGYSNLREVLIREPVISDALEISPSQRRHLASLQPPPEIAKYWGVAAERARKKRPSNDREHILFELDAFFEKQLNEILLPEQIDALRPLMLQHRYASGVEPFTHYEVLEYCGFEASFENVEEWKKTIQPPVQEATKLQRQLDSAVAKEIFTQLADESKVQFVQLFGNSLAPEVAVKSALPEDLPFLTNALGGAVTYLNQQLLGAANVTEAQKKQIIEVRVYRSHQTRNFRKLKTASDIGKRMDEIEDELHFKIRKILSNEQLVAFGRAHSAFALTNNPRLVLTHSPWREYLKIDNTDVDKISQAIDTALQLERKRLLPQQQQLFRDVCEKLEPKVRERAEKLFGSGWPSEPLVPLLSVRTMRPTDRLQFP